MIIVCNKQINKCHQEVVFWEYGRTPTRKIAESAQPSSQAPPFSSSFPAFSCVPASSLAVTHKKSASVDAALQRTQPGDSARRTLATPQLLIARYSYRGIVGDSPDFDSSPDKNALHRKRCSRRLKETGMPRDRSYDIVCKPSRACWPRCALRKPPFRRRLRAGCARRPAVAASLWRLRL